MNLTKGEAISRWLALRAEPFLTLVEDILERNGKCAMAQMLRSKQCGWQAIASEKLILLMQSMAAVDMRRRETIQKEAFLLAECQTFDRKGLTEEEKHQLQDSQEELEHLSQELWRLERERYILWRRVPYSPLRRAIVSSQKNPKSHMTKWLRNDSAGRGGCCDRGCGCCERPRSATRAKSFGHCTSECACCRKACGFELSSPEDRKSGNIIPASLSTTI
ncbi:hypothetical protein BO71DRAFT_421832 [Aspergillus ellipticus CBS 707.79]|uniref:Uncharacterized protein n=1 Tax=Aspergillus ellipticus CBS 707.79 TaxID=1448320 RepID=A0A319D1D3_9EURO|nr:hypothetical protein BO71DRAFT_421832 [Aspergillus ellipticus CBS 707.79]